MYKKLVIKVQTSNRFHIDVTKYTARILIYKVKTFTKYCLMREVIIYSYKPKKNQLNKCDYIMLKERPMKNLKVCNDLYKEI